MAESVLDTLVTRLAFRGDFAAVNRYEQGMRRLEAQARRWADTAGRAFNRVGNQMVRFGTAAAGAGVGALKLSANFESEMAKIEGLVGISRSQLDEWRSDIFRIARETGKAPAELAKALFFITSAGQRGTVAIDTLTRTAMASVAGLGEQAVVADLVTSAMDVYGAEVLNASTATDIFTAAVREGKLDPETLAGPISAVLPFAQELGVDLAQVAGSMAAMSRGGIDASRGAVAMRGVLGKIIKPARNAEKELAKIGWTMNTLRDLVGERGLVPALRLLREAFGGNSEMLSKVFFDQESLLGVLTLTGDKYEDNIAIIDKVTDSAGVLDAAFNAQADTLDFRWSQMMARVKTLLIDLGDRLGPTADKFFAFAEGLAGRFEELDGPAKDFVANILAWSPAVIGAGTALRGLGLAFSPLITVLSALLSPIGLVVAAIAAAGAAIWIWRDEIGGFVSSLAEQFPIIGTLVDGVTAKWAELSEAVRDKSPTEAASALWQLLRDNVETAVGAVAAAVSSAWSAVGDAFADLMGRFPAMNGMLGYVRGAWDHLWSAVGRLGGALGRLWDVLSPLVRSLGSALAPVLRVVAGILGGVLLTALKVVGAVIGGTVLIAVTALTAAFGVVVDILALAVTGITMFVDWLTGIPGTISNFVGSVGGFFSSLGEQFRQIFDLSNLLDLYEIGRNLIGALIDGISSRIGDLVDKVAEVAGSIRNFLPFSDAKVGPLSTLTESGRRLVTTFAAGAESAEGAMPDTLLRLLNPTALAAAAVPLPAGPLPLPPVPAAVGGPSFSVTIRELIVQAPSGEAETVAGEVVSQLDDMLRGLAEEYDTREVA